MISSAMAWHRCRQHSVVRNILAAEVSSVLHTKSILHPRALPGSMHQCQRYVHNRSQSAWDVAKTNVARVRPIGGRDTMSFCTKVTSTVVLGAMGVGGVSIYDDYLIFQQVCKKALAKANMDSEFKAIVGDNIGHGPWYEACMTVDHGGHSAACNFAVTGSLCSANIHLRVVRYEETDSFASYFMLPGSGEWELVVLEAVIHGPSSGDQENPKKIDLLRRDEAASRCA